MQVKRRTPIKQTTNLYKNICHDEWLDDFCGDFGIACSFCPVKLLSEEGATYG